MSHERKWRWEVSRFDSVKTRIKIGQWEGKQQEPVVDHPPILNPRIIHIALCSGCILHCAKGDYEEARERVTCVRDGREGAGVG